MRSVYAGDRTLIGLILTALVPIPEIRPMPAPAVQLAQSRRSTGVLDGDRSQPGTVTLVANALCVDGRYLLSIRNHPTGSPELLSARVNGRAAHDLGEMRRLRDVLAAARSAYLHEVSCDPAGGLHVELRGIPSSGQGQFSERFYWRQAPANP